MRWLAVPFVAVIVFAGCGEGRLADEETPEPTEAPADAPWPAAFRNTICLAATRSEHAYGLWAAWSRGDTGIFFTSIADQGRYLDANAETMQMAIDRAPSWAPGNELVRQLTASTKNLHRAAELLQEGDEEQSEAKVLKAGELMAKGGDQATVAGAELTKLGDEYGFYCP